jgi:membrane carboxypeptidase/penicillin-binding protein PbpC
MVMTIDLIPDNSTIAPNETVHLSVDISDENGSVEIHWYVDGEEITENENSTTFDFTPENSGGYIVQVTVTDEEPTEVSDKSVIIVESETLLDIWNAIAHVLGAD